MTELPYLQGYPDNIRQQVQHLLATGKLAATLAARYPKNSHNIQTDKALYDYTQQLKRQYMKSSEPISKAVFDPKIHIINNALGTHTQISRVQGGKLKSKNEIRIASQLKQLPLPLLRMVVVHELAHLTYFNHSAQFWQLVEHHYPDARAAERYLKQNQHWMTL
mgnify:CR=1 FL=1